MDKPLLKVEIKYEHDVVLARQRARQIAELTGFDAQDQVRIATAVSELARNAFQYAGGGRVEFCLTSEQPQSLKTNIRDQGRGITHLDNVLGGNYKSETGMGVGIIGARRLMDCFDITSTSQGTTVTVSKELPRKTSTITPKEIAGIIEKLANQTSYDPFQELQRQNQELLSALDEVQKQRTTLSELNQELEETNRGVVALYAELDERADYLKRASELKTQFLSNMTHEFRTPLNSILSISQILLERMDGELNYEQEKQITFIQTGAKSLSDLVNDLLDLAKVEAGKVSIKPEEFVVEEMFRVLRGMLKPLTKSNNAINLIFDEPENIPPVFSDEGKVSQILRNFISNGLKYTQEGEVRVTASFINNTVIFSVSDTGIGIAPKDRDRIFEEFTQVEGTHQQKIKGTGLGLPLSRKLAELLGGHVLLKSVSGKGSIFSLVLPLRYTGPKEVHYLEHSPSIAAKRYERILIIDDSPADRYVIRKWLENYAHFIIEATNASEGLAMAERDKPSAIILDLVMPDLGGEDVLIKLKKQKHTRHIPVIINTSRTLTSKERESLLSKAAAILAKGSANQSSLVQELENSLEESSLSEKEASSYA